MTAGVGAADRRQGAALVDRPAASLAGRYPLALPALGAVAGALSPGLAFRTFDEALMAVTLSLLAALVLGRRRMRRSFHLASTVGFFALASLVVVPLVEPPGPASVARLAYRFPGPATLIGTVAAHPSALPGQVSFPLEIDFVRSRGVESEVSGRVSVAVHGMATDGVPVPNWRRGDRLAIAGSLAPPRDFATPGVGSAAAWLARRGVGARLSVKSPARVTVGARATPGPIDRLREHIVAAIDRHVAGGRRPSTERDGEVVPESRAASLLRAVLVADRALLDPEAKRALAEAGLIHLLAISGLHVGMIGGFAYLVVAWGTGREGARVAATLGVVWCYTLAAGAPGPALRAAILATVVLLGRSLARDAPAGNSLCLALLIGIVLEPGGVRDAGFQMTYAAALGLLVLSPRLTVPWRPRRLWQALAVSLGAQLAVLPLSVYHFGRIGFGGVVLNLIAVPIAALMVGCGFLVAALDLLPFAAPAAFAADAARLLVTMMYAIAEPDLPWSFRVGTPPGWLAGLLGGAILLGFARWLRPWPFRLAPAVLALLAVAAPRLWRGPSAPPGTTSVVAIDVGQGDAVLIELPGGETLLADAGGFPRSRFDVGDRVVVPYLLGRGHRSLDVVVVSHAHPDHAGGVAAVLRELDVSELWIGDEPVDDPLVGRLRRLAERRGTRVVEVRRGLSRVFTEGVSVEVLNPRAAEPPPLEVDNSRSVVVRLRTPGGDIVLTGDIHSDAEADLLAEGFVGRTAVLKVAHHGSRTSSSTPFVVASAPRLALVSCGFQNRFGHPDAAVVGRLVGAGSSVRRTDLDGTTVVELARDGTIKVATQRVRYRDPLAGYPGFD